MIHHVFANRSNIGDWLSAKGIQSLLAPVEVTEHLCDGPFVPETLEALGKACPGDLVVIGGGGLFMDYFEPLWEGLREIADRVPLCIWGAGYCDLKREHTRAPSALIGEVVQRSRLCIVRDELTRTILSSCSLPPPVPCPSIAAIQGPFGSGHGVLHVDNYFVAGPDVFDVMDQTGRCFSQETGRVYRQANNRIEAGDEGAMAGKLSGYAQADIVLSSALHGCIIGVAMGRKVLAVSGDWKIESFMEVVGLADWVIDISEPNRIADGLRQLSEQEPVRGFPGRARQANVRVAEGVLRLVDDARAAQAPGLA